MMTISFSPATPAASWVERFTEIKLVLGEFCLGVVRFRAVVLADGYWLSNSIIDEAEIRQKLQPGVEAVCLPSQPAAETLSKLTFRRYAICYVPVRFGRFYVDLRGTFSDYLKKFSQKPRHNLLRSVRKFAELNGGQSVFREYRDPAVMQEFYDLARSISERTYQHQLLKASLPDTPEFFQQITQMAESGMLRGYILFHKASPVAFAYCTARHNRLTYQVIGYDPDFRRHSPGTVLLFHILEHLFEEQRFQTFDFGTGEAFYKSFFATDSVPCATVYFFPYSVKALVFVGMHLGLRVLSVTAVRLLSLLRLKSVVKKTLRRVR